MGPFYSHAPLGGVFRGRVGFSLSRALEKCGSPHPYFSRKNWQPFFHHRLSALQYHPYLFSPEKLTTFFGGASLSPLFISLVHSGVAHYFRHAKKFAAPLVGPVFCGGPCSAEHAEQALIRRCSGWFSLAPVTSHTCRFVTCLFRHRDEFTIT